LQSPDLYPRTFRLCVTLKEKVQAYVSNPNTLEEVQRKYQV
jgi:hypothetical protein